MQSEKYSRIQVRDALKIILNRNYTWRFSNLEISPDFIRWHVNVKRKISGSSDEKRVIVFYDKTQTVTIKEEGQEEKSISAGELVKVAKYATV